MSVSYGTQSAACADKVFPTIDQESILCATERIARTENAYLANHLIDGLWIYGRFDTKALHNPIDRILKRHSALRTFFRVNPNVLPSERESRLNSLVLRRRGCRPLYRQHVAREGHLPLREMVLNDLVNERLALQEHVRREYFEAFDLGCPPLVRILLMSITRERRLLLIVMHHVISDMFSQRLFRDELVALLSDPPRPLLPVSEDEQFTAFARLQMTRIENSVFEAQLSSAVANWAGSEAAQIRLCDFEATEGFGESDHPMLHVLPLGEALSCFVRDEARKVRVTPFILLFAVFCSVLKHFTGKRSLSVWIPLLNRESGAFTRTIGCFATRQLLTVTLPDGITWAQCLVEVRERVLSAISTESVPVGLVWEALERRPALSDLHVSFQCIPWAAPVTSGPLMFRQLEFPLRQVAVMNRSLDLVVVETENDLVLTVGRGAGSLSDRTIRLLLERFRSFVGGVAARSECFG